MHRSLKGVFPKKEYFKIRSVTVIVSFVRLIGHKVFNLIIQIVVHEESADA